MEAEGEKRGRSRRGKEGREGRGEGEKEGKFR